MTLLPEGFAFSQTALEDYAACARRFELRYLQDVRWPALETEPVMRYETRLEQGALFHHLAHQYALGIDADLLESTIRDPEVLDAWRRFMPWTQAHMPPRWQAELTLSVPVGDVIVLAKMDAISITEDRLTIVDWKLGSPPTRERLASRWQTRIYPYVLAGAGAWLNAGRPVQPETIRMIYWFAADGTTVTFDFDAAQAQQTQAALLRVIGEIERTPDNGFMLTPDLRTCQFCVYRSLCDRGVRAGEMEDEAMRSTDADGPLTLDLDALDEIAF